jgi:hypothetical protein
VYNVHSLSHICDDIDKFGPINEFSCFPFESFMRQVKHYVKGPKRPAVQIINRLQESTNHQQSQLLNGFDRIPISLHRRYHKSLCQVKPDLYISCTPPDNCVIYRGIPFFIVRLQGNFAYGKRLQDLKDVYTHAIRSSQINIFSSSSMSSEIARFPCHEITCKCVLFKTDDKYFVFPLLHTIKID